MKKALRIIIPVVLAVIIIFSTVWYLFVYDRAFTRDVLLSCARFSEANGNHNIATWFYNTAYSQSGNSDDVAIELARQYVSSGNYTKAEFTLSNAIADGGGVDLYIELCKIYVEQDKLLDAVTMLDGVTNAEAKMQLDAMRPEAPTVAPAPGFYSQYISVTLTSENNIIYNSVDGKYPTTKKQPYSQPLTLVDGENTIHAVSVNETGLVSPLAIYGYTVGGVVKEMSFTDPAIEATIRDILKVNEDKLLYTNDLWTIKDFTVPANAKNYSDLTHMTFLESLTIKDASNNDFSFISSLANLLELTISNASISQEQLQAIASLPLLKQLTLSDCNLTNIEPLSKAVALTYLDLNNNTIRSINALSALTQLQDLNLSHNAVADLASLSALTALKTLDISHNAVKSLTPICTLTGLSKVSAGVNSITDLGNIGNLTSLNYLSLEYNQLTNVSGISKCKSITELNLSSNKITDISSFSALNNLMYFNFSYNQVKEIPKFSKNCALVTIDGSNNKISSLNNLGGLKNLNNINMDYNTEISSVKALASCPVLVEVNVYGTKVKDVTSLTKQSIIVNYKPV